MIYQQHQIVVVVRPLRDDKSAFSRVRVERPDLSYIGGSWAHLAHLRLIYWLADLVADLAHLPP